MNKISVVIITFNEEKNIARCIHSAEGLADEILVVDSFSKDNTIAICEELGAKVIQHAFDGYIEQKNYAVSKCEFDYVLSLDADEALSDQLYDSIKKVKEDLSHDCYSFNRLTYYGGRFIKHCGWYPDVKIRLWDRRKGSWGGDNPHDKVVMNPSFKLKHLKGDLLHYTYDSIEDHLNQANKFTTISALSKFNKGIRTNIIKIYFYSKFRFFRDYILYLGFLDGFYGYMISKINAYSVFLKYSKLLDMQREMDNRNIKSSIHTTLLVTTYNRIEALELVLKSVLNQKIMPDEVIVADDGSTDETRRLIDRYRRRFSVPLIHCWHEDNGFRLSEIRNKAIALSKGEYIVMVDGDMILHPFFIGDHIKHAKKNYFIQGSRVLLSEDLSQERLSSKNIRFNWYSKGLLNKFNSIHNRFFSYIFSGVYGAKDYRAVRGCNMSFWKSDVYDINGFNQDFIGWGREDSEFVVRLLNSGIKRKNLKFAGVAYHIYHKVNVVNSTFEKNQAILEDAILQKRKKCSHGIDKVNL